MRRVEVDDVNVIERVDRERAGAAFVVSARGAVGIELDGSPRAARVRGVAERGGNDVTVRDVNGSGGVHADGRPRADVASGVDL